MPPVPVPPSSPGPGLTWLLPLLAHLLLGRVTGCWGAQELARRCGKDPRYGPSPRGPSAGGGQPHHQDTVSRAHSIPNSPHPCTLLLPGSPGTGGAGEELPIGRTGGTQGSTALLGPWLLPAPSHTPARASGDAQQDQPAPWQLCHTAPSTMCHGPCLLVWGLPPLLPAPQPALHPSLHPSPHPAPLRLALPLHAAKQVAANLPRSTSTAARAGCCPATAYGAAASLCHRAPGSHQDGPPSSVGYRASGHGHVPMHHPVPPASWQP